MHRIGLSTTKTTCRRKPTVSHPLRLHSKEYHVLSLKQEIQPHCKCTAKRLGISKWHQGVKVEKKRRMDCAKRIFPLFAALKSTRSDLPQVCAFCDDARRAETSSIRFRGDRALAPSGRAVKVRPRRARKSRPRLRSGAKR